MPQPSDERVLVGYATSDDAGVYLLRDDLALVQTVDFFTPIVDDPYDFGRIAAANAFSDLYAMGAQPISALNIASFPKDALDLTILERILQGGASIAREAGAVILGGHTIVDEEPKYGMAVTGTADPRRLVTNAAAKPGDLLVLTKPIGTGVFATALKRDLIRAPKMEAAVASMTQLNAQAARAMIACGAHAATDVTGFGLLGHAAEMGRASAVALEIDAERVPLLDGTLDLIAQGAIAGGSKRNEAEHAAFTTFAPRVARELRVALSDAQTSGGLLIALAPDRLHDFESSLAGTGVLAAAIGRVTRGEGIAVL